MSKMRSDCVFSKLTPEQVETLEGWLFEENLSYQDALERAQKEFGIESSLTGLRRFYGRLAKERNKESLADAMNVCVQAASLGNDEVLRAGLLTMANACGVQYLMQPPKDIKQFTAMLRALTSAQGQEMRWIKFEREEGWNWRSRMREEARKSKQEEENRQRVEVNEERSEEKGAGNAEKAGSETDPRVNATSPRPSPPKAEREKVLAAQKESKAVVDIVTPIQAAERGQEVVGSIPVPKNGSVLGNGAERASGTAVVVPLKAA